METLESGFCKNGKREGGTRKRRVGFSARPGRDEDHSSPKCKNRRGGSTPHTTRHTSPEAVAAWRISYCIVLAPRTVGRLVAGDDLRCRGRENPKTYTCTSTAERENGNSSGILRTCRTRCVALPRLLTWIVMLIPPPPQRQERLTSIPDSKTRDGGKEVILAST